MKIYQVCQNCGGYYYIADKKDSLTKNGSRPFRVERNTDSQSIDWERKHGQEQLRIPSSGNATALDKYRMSYPSLDDTFRITIYVREDVFHHVCRLHVRKKEIRAWLNKKPIYPANVAVYIKYLYESRPSNKYAFFCPKYLAAAYEDSEENKQFYMADSMCKREMKNRICFAPYCGGYHWMLAVINPWDNIVYWLDSSYSGPSDHYYKFRAMIENAISIFLAQKGKINGKKTHWVNISCPQQQNNVDCGYYICRYMREIMDHQCTVVPSNYFRGSPCFYDKELDELREEWLQYLDTQR